MDKIARKALLIGIAMLVPCWVGKEVCSLFGCEEPLEQRPVRYFKGVPFGYGCYESGKSEKQVPICPWWTYGMTISLWVWFFGVVLVSLYDCLTTRYKHWTMLRYLIGPDGKIRIEERTIIRVPDDIKDQWLASAGIF